MGWISESEKVHTRQHPSSCGTLTTGCDLLRLAGCRVLAFTCRDDPFRPRVSSRPTKLRVEQKRTSSWNNSPRHGWWCSRPENSFPILFNPHHPTLQPLPSTNCNNIHRSPTIPNHPQPSSPPTPHPYNPTIPHHPPAPNHLLLGRLRVAP